MDYSAVVEVEGGARGGRDLEQVCLSTASTLRSSRLLVLVVLLLTSEEQQIKVWIIGRGRDWGNYG